MVKVIHVNRTPEKWVKLVTYFRHSGKPLHMCVFPDVQTAKNAHSRLGKAIDYACCNMVVVRRDCVVYVMNPMMAQKVVIDDE